MDKQSKASIEKGVLKEAVKRIYQLYRDTNWDVTAHDKRTGLLWAIEELNNMYEETREQQ